MTHSLEQQQQKKQQNGVVYTLGIYSVEILVELRGVRSLVLRSPQWGGFQTVRDRGLTVRGQINWLQEFGRTQTGVDVDRGGVPVDTYCQF